MACSGLLGLLAVGWHRSELDGTGWPVVCLVVLLGGFLATGLVGMVLNRTVRPG